MYGYATEFCRKTGFPKKTLWRMLRKGELPSRKIGRKYLIDLEKTAEQLNVSYDFLQEVENLAKKNKHYGNSA
jgi:excisionase family DNA binding protein